MNIIKLLIVVGIVGFGYQYWVKHSAQGSGTVAISGASESGKGGFVQLPSFDAGSSAAVIVVAAENCPEEDARRADDLAAELRKQGIPVARSHSVSFTFSGADAGLADRVSALMNGKLPIVLVNGRGKANPALDDVMA